MVRRCLIDNLASMVVDVWAVVNMPYRSLGPGGVDPAGMVLR
jgi:hypothetical protein